MKNYQNFLRLSQEMFSKLKLFFKKYYKNFSRPVLFLTILFCIGLFPLLQANVNYLDDSARALDGGRGWLYLHSRWISEYLSILLHADLSLRDISPFPQLIAIFLISLASVMLCWIVFDKKLTKLGILISALLGFSPFYLECFAFKFDSPYMALSIFASIFPFLFAFKNNKLFALVSFLGILTMLTTYQLSGGVYIMVTIFLLFQTWNTRTKTLQELVNFLAIAVGSYLGALVFFRIFLLQTKILAYNNFFQLGEMLPGIFKNLKNNFENIIGNLNIFWIWILAVIIIMFIVKSVVTSKQNKILSLLITLTTIVLIFFFFQGFFIFIDNVGSVPRYLLGFNTFIALSSLSLAKSPYRLFSAPAIILLYCFFVFTLAFGNALDDQKSFKTFFATMLINDLSKIIKNDDGLKETPIYLMDSIGNAPSVKFLKKDYPIIKHLIPNDFGKHVFGYTNLAWYNFPVPTPDQTRVTKEQKQRAKELPVLVDSYYYTIGGNNEGLYVWFNNR